MAITWCTTDTAESGFHARVEDAWAAWRAAGPCADWEAEDLGDCADAPSADVSFVWADPDDVLDTGVALAELTTDSGGLEIVFNDDYTWSTDADVAAGTCSDALSVDLLLRHELGHALGLPHTCEQGEPCTDADAAAAVMYWSTPTCDARPLNAADSALLLPEYGPHPPDAGADVIGAAPFEVCPSVPGDPNVIVYWRFGDGGTAEGNDVCHTYEIPNVYTVVATWELSPACGGATGVVLPWALVTVTADGTDDTGADSGTDADKPGAGSCGCASGSGAALPALLAWVAAALLVRVRRS